VRCGEGLAAHRMSSRVVVDLVLAEGSRKVAHADAGWSSSVARRAHNPEVAGSNPAPATKLQARRSQISEPERIRDSIRQPETRQKPGRGALRRPVAGNGMGCHGAPRRRVERRRGVGVEVLGSQARPRMASWSRSSRSCSARWHVGTLARIGEVLAIRKCDVDVTASPATVRICGTIASPKGKPIHRQPHPKTQKTTRTVSVPSFAAEALRQRFVIIAGEEPEHLIFFSRNHTPLTTNSIRRRLRAVLEGVEIEGVTPALLPADRCHVPRSCQRPGPGGRDAPAHVQQGHQVALHPA